MGLLGKEVFLSPVFLFVGSRPQPHDLPWAPKDRFEQLLIKGGLAKKPPVVTVVQLLSCIQLFATPWSAVCQASLSFTISQSFLKLMFIELMMPSKHLILCSPPTPFALNLSQHQSLFQWVGSLHQVAKMLELQLQHQSFQGIFRVDFL